MNGWNNVARYHLAHRLNFMVLPWAILTFVFAVDLVIVASITAGNGSVQYVGGLASILILLFVLGVQSVARSLPFGLALGISRRTYFLGTAMLAVGYGVVFGLTITVAQAVERATSGWGVNMGFFRVPHVLDGPWYLTLVTSFVTLTLAFVYGMWNGLVYRRWGMVGAAVFVAGQITVLLIAALAVTWTHTWHQLGIFLADVGAAGLTAVLAVIAAALLVGGLTTMRRVTV